MLTADDVSIRQVPFEHPDGGLLTREVQAYYVELYGGPDTSPVEPGEFAPPKGAFFIGYAGAEPIAMGGWRFYPSEPPLGARPAEIRRMFVVAAWRGGGVARRLLAQLEDSARTAGADAMVLESGLPQRAAVALYRAAGYEDVPHFGHYASARLAVHLGKLLVARQSRP